MLAPEPYPTVERDSRLYLAQTPAIYLFAVDEAAKRSNANLHDVFKVGIGGNYFGPVEDVLAEDTSRSKSALDLGCDSGKWVNELAEQFPDVQFTGVDIAQVPPSNQNAPSNVHFEYCDVTEGTRFDDNTFDVVHIRIMIATTTDFQALLTEAARILRPGGLLLSGEFSWFNHIETLRSVPMSVYVPSFSCFVKTIVDLYRGMGLNAVVEEVQTLVRTSGLFKDDHSVVYTWPVGAHQSEELEEQAELGQAMAEYVMELVAVSRWLFKETGWSDEQYDELTANIKEEILSKPGILAAYYMTYAFKA